MPRRDVFSKKDPRLSTEDGWYVSSKKGFRANILVWGMPRDFSTLEIRAKLADLGLAGFTRGSVSWEGEHIRLVLTPKDSKGLTKDVVTRVSACLRKIGCRCVFDDSKDVSVPLAVPSQTLVHCVNRFEPLTNNVCRDEHILNVEKEGGIDVRAVSERVKVVQRERRLRVATWNFSGLCSDRKQKEVEELLHKLNLDVVAGQESWEKEGTIVSVEGYKWFGKPRKDQNSQRGEGGVGFLIRDCLIDEVEFISNVRYEESVWMKVRGGRGREALYIGCLYMPTTSASVSVMESSYGKLKEDVLSFKQKGRVVLLGDFNARVGKAADMDDVIGMFGEETCNASGNRLLSFLNEVELVICNGRQLVSEPEWTRVRPSLKQKSVIDYVITDSQLMKESGAVQVDSMDVGSSDHFLVWLELGRTAKFVNKGKRVIRRWRLDKFVDDEVKARYRQALCEEVRGFSESIKLKLGSGMQGKCLVNEVLVEWESIVNKVAKAEVGDKMIVCGKAARWWDDEVKAKIEHRRQVYREIVSGHDELWNEYYKLRKEVKHLIIEKKLNVWNDVVEKANSDFEGNKKEFWAFVGRRTKGRKKGIPALKSDDGVSVTSTKGKLQILQSHYKELGSSSVDVAFDVDWKEEVENKVRDYTTVSAEFGNDVLDGAIEPAEIFRCIKKLKNNKTGGSDGLVGELLKYGGSGMVDLLQILFSVIWREEIVPPQWREGLIVNLFKKGDKEDPGNYRGISLLSVVGKVFCKILNNRLVQHLDEGRVLHEGQAGFRRNRCCTDNVYTLNEIVQGRLREGKETYAFFLDVQKAYDTVWRSGLWLKLWDLGVKGRIWRVIKKMYESSRSSVLLEGEKSASFSVEQGVAQGCSLSPILFSVFINDLLKEVEKAELGIQLGESGKIGGMLFADDFVGVSDSEEQLQKLINVVHAYCNKWRLKANITKSAVMVFAKEPIEGSWKWGERELPSVSNYTYLGIDFAFNGAWDMHIKKVLDSGRKKVNQLHSVLSNRDINMSARRLLLLSVVRPSLEYGSEVWEGNKCQVAAIESVILGGAKRILGCSSKTCSEAVRGDMGLETLQGRRDLAKLKWWYKLATMSEDRYPRKMFSQDWNVKPSRGRQRKVWSRLIDDLFVSLGLDQAEWLQGIQNGDSLLKAFLALIEESICEREGMKFEEGLNSKVKLTLYRSFGRKVEFKRYLHGVMDAGSRLLFKFRSGTHGLNEELGRHRGRDGKKECELCGNECESVSHVLWECPAYGRSRAEFLSKLEETIGSDYEHFNSLDNLGKSCFVLGNEQWEKHFESLLHIVKDYIVEVWEERKIRLYGDDSCASQSHSQFSTGDPGVAGRSGKEMCQGGKPDTGKLYTTPIGVHACCSAHDNGCVVNGLSGGPGPNHAQRANVRPAHQYFKCQ